MGQKSMEKEMSPYVAPRTLLSMSHTLSSSHTSLLPVYTHPPYLFLYVMYVVVIDCGTCISIHSKAKTLIGKVVEDAGGSMTTISLGPTIVSTHFLCFDH